MSRVSTALQVILYHWATGETSLAVYKIYSLHFLITLNILLLFSGKSIVKKPDDSPGFFYYLITWFKNLDDQFFFLFF